MTQITKLIIQILITRAESRIKPETGQEYSVFDIRKINDIFTIKMIRDSNTKADTIMVSRLRKSI